MGIERALDQPFQPGFIEHEKGDKAFRLRLRRVVAATASNRPKRVRIVRHDAQHGLGPGKSCNIFASMVENGVDLSVARRKYHQSFCKALSVNVREGVSRWP